MKKVVNQEKGQRDIDVAGQDNSGIFEAFEGVSPCTDYQEKGFHCRHCERELLHVEKDLYGNECLFCTEQPLRKYSLFKCLLKAWLDWRIYRALIKIRKEYGETAFFLLTGVLGVIGVQQLGSLYSIPLKREFLKEVKEVLRVSSKRKRSEQTKNVSGSGKHNPGTQTAELGREEERSQEENEANISSGQSGYDEVSLLRRRLSEGA